MESTLSVINNESFYDIAENVIVYLNTNNKNVFDSIKIKFDNATNSNVSYYLNGWFEVYSINSVNISDYTSNIIKLIGKNSVYNISNPIVLDNHCFVITVLFRDSKLRLLSLYCIDEDISYEQEELRKKLHKKVLKEQGLSNINVFSWGIVKLEYDPRISRYSIDVIYNP